MYLVLILAGQLALLTTMSWLLLISDRLASEANRSREIIFKGTVIAGHLMDSSKSLGLYLLSQSHPAEEVYTASLRHFQEGFLQLQEMAAPDDAHLMATVLKDSEQLVFTLEAIRKISAEAPFPLLTKRQRHRLQSLGSQGCPVILTRLRQDVKALIHKHEKATDDSSAQTTRRLLVLVAAAGALLNLGGCFALITAFTQRITNRLAILRDNTLLMTGGAPLRPYVDGTDEIAKLDKFFHTMADELNAATARDKIILTSIPVGIITLTPDTTIQFANPRFEQMTGFNQNELARKTLGFFLPEVSAVKSCEELEPFMNKVTQSMLTHKNGVPLIAEFSFARYEEEDHIVVVCSILDVTARHEMERLKREFVNIVSHDLRTPLTSVQSILRLLKSGSYGLIRRDGIEKLDFGMRECVRLIRLVTDLLTVSKIESGRLTLNFELLSIQDLMERSIASVRPLADDRELSIDLRTADLTIPADEERLMQVFTNLLSNAIKCSPEGGTVYFRCEKLDAALRISVRDEGCGIPAEAHSRIFERLDRTKPGGAVTETALDLTIAKMIVDCHHGQIGVISKEGEGSEYWMVLPLELEQPPESPPAMQNSIAQ